jgi:hypothetical protein
MKKNGLRILSLLIVFAGLCILPASAAAQAADTAPKIAVVVSLQQATLRISDQAMGVLEVSNQSDVPADDARLAAGLPDFLVLHDDSCTAQPVVGAIDLGLLPAHSVKSQAFCITLNPVTAQAGSFNVLFTITYTWGPKTDLTTAEKSLSVDLIGSQTILGLPLAFAGFILPGLMCLLVLRWFKAPWAVGLSGEDKLVFAVLLSIVMLVLLDLLGSLAGFLGWVQFLNFSQEVTIGRLIAYVVIGTIFGLVIGRSYRRSRMTGNGRWLRFSSASTTTTRPSSGSRCCSTRNTKAGRSLSATSKRAAITRAHTTSNPTASFTLSVISG